MVPVFEAYKYLLTITEKCERGWLIRPMLDLSEMTHLPHTLALLENLRIDAMDVWIAYQLLSEREASPRGREACKFLAEQLSYHLRGQVHTYDKTGALFLWALFCRLHKGRPQQEMYRVAAALILPGRDRFQITPTGPIHSRADEEAINHKQLYAVSTRAGEIREEVRVYFSGDRDHDLAPFLPEEMIIARDEWENESRQRHITAKKAALAQGASVAGTSLDRPDLASGSTCSPVPEEYNSQCAASA